ncbi:MAG: hypothetical protein Kow00127_08530 [Bacteroidales bacterium]
MGITDVNAQVFTNINAGLPGLHFSDVAWCDYDSDGDLDVLMAGLNESEEAVTTLYRNDGDDTFTEVTGLGIPGTFIGDLAWGDYDGDGDPDILVQGVTATADLTALYENTGNDTFVDSGVELPAVSDGTAGFVDYNNDGLQDLFIVGYDGNTYVALLYRNNGNKDFTLIETPFPGTIKGAAEWADFNNDGYQDLFLSGYDWQTNFVAHLYANNGNGSFTELETPIPGTWLGDASWGDYDLDGDPDLITSGFNLTGRITKLFKNQGNGQFSEVTAADLTGVSHCSTIWGDYDNDGDPDIFLTGTYESGANWVRVMDVFINNGDETFTPAELEFTADSFWGESAWGDYDGDGDLDLVCSGYDDAGGCHTYIYRNESPVANTPPETPMNLVTTVSDNTVTMSWDAASDAETPSEGLTYNIYIHDDNGYFICPPYSILSTGKRLLPAIGNAGQVLSHTIGNLPNGTYYWSVQAVDNCFEGSSFADEEMFMIGTSGTDEVGDPFVRIFPNPSSGKISIDLSGSPFGETQISVFNDNGLLLYESEWLVNDRDDRFTTDLSQYPAGIYFIRITTAGNQIVRKVVVR